MTIVCDAGGYPDGQVRPRLSILIRGASNGRATGEDAGYLKLVFDGTTEKVLGVQMVSYAAAELIQLCALAIRAGADARLVSGQLSIHPSHGERLLKIFAHDYHEVCEAEWARA